MLESVPRGEGRSSTADVGNGIAGLGGRFVEKGCWLPGLKERCRCEVEGEVEAKRGKREDKVGCFRRATMFFLRFA